MERSRKSCHAANESAVSNAVSDDIDGIIQLQRDDDCGEHYMYVHHVSVVLPDTQSTIRMNYFCRIYNARGEQVQQQQQHARRKPLFIGLHGGGGCPAPVNDQQWKNHCFLYHETYKEMAQRDGPLVYVAPRAPTNTWDLWHQDHMDRLLDALIAQLVASPRTHVNSNKVYLSGYSAGGDGVYMLAPRMADRWAGAAMMAGHPNGISLRGVYNLPFTLHVGAKDDAYNRNGVAQEYAAKLQQWKRDDEIIDGNSDMSGRGYASIWPRIYENSGHWLNLQDAAALPWMARHTRQTFPTTILWDAGSERHERFYWISRTGTTRLDGEIKVSRAGQKFTIDLSKCSNFYPEQEHFDAIITLRLNDTMVDLDEPIVMYVRVANDVPKLIQTIQALRNISVLAETLSERGNPNAIFSAQVAVHLKQVDRFLSPVSSTRTRLRG